MPLPPPPPPGQAPGGSSTAAVCYRHPQREAGRRCTRCGRWACNDCLVQASVGSHCIDCAKASRPATTTRVKYWSARQPTLVTYALMAINAAVFLWIALEEPSSLTRSGTTRGQAKLVLSAQLFDGPVRWPFPDGAYISQPDEWYRIITAGFVHFGLIHILFNMLLLFQLGQMLEPAIGRVRFALVYFAALVGGSAGAMLLQPDGLHGGASGAVFGLMGAAFVGFRQRGINPFSTGIGTTLLLNLFLTFTIPGISIGGHLGGVAAGALCAFVTLAPASRGFPRWASYAVPVLVTAAGLVVTVYAINAA